MAAKVSIHPLTLETVDVACALAREMHSLSPISRIAAYSPERVRAWATNSLSSDDHLVNLAAVDGEYVGIMVGGLYQLNFSESKVGYEEFIYVRQMHGRLKVGMALLNAFTLWCLSKEVVDILPGVMAGIADKGADIMYRLAGYKRVGTTYSYMRKV